MSSRFLSHDNYHARANNLIVQNFIKILFADTSKMPKNGHHFVNKGALLCYSLSIREQIVANQSVTFVIEH